MLINKDVLHFRLLAKYVAAFFTIANSSACSANWRFRRAFIYEKPFFHCTAFLLT
jgi:hypothetical protein